MQPRNKLRGVWPQLSRAGNVAISAYVLGTVRVPAARGRDVSRAVWGMHARALLVC
eukprot:COSAG02_NODE_4918_length_4836_cov_122.848427_5_plen_56_part_00